MPKLYLVRHGEAAAGWTEDPDPGLSIRGRDQARDLADALVGLLSPMPVITSPLRRTRDTADALANRWGMAAEIEAAVGEVPTPEGTPLEDRGTWLRDFMESAWSDASPDLLAWRAGVIDALSALGHDAVVVTHYVAINTVVGAAEANDRVINFRPGNCSVTVVEREGTDFTVIERGAQANTLVL